MRETGAEVLTASIPITPDDVEAIRAEFPILSRRVHGKPLVYLDNAATSQKPVQVIAELTRFYRDHNANIHRGVHTLSVESTELYEEARAKIAAFIGAADAREIVFTRNTTESINLVAHAWGRAFLQPGDEVVVSEIEHHSNIVPWQMLRDERGIVLRYIPMLPDGTLDLEAARRLIGPKTKLLSITAMSNALGTIVPLHEIIPLAKAQGATVLVDGAQSVPHLAVDVQALGADFLVGEGERLPFAVGWTMLATASERFPRGGALLMGLMGTAGMLSIQFFLPMMGQVFDTTKVELAGGEAAFSALQPGPELELILGQAAQTSVRYVAVLPAILLIVFGAIWLYDRSKGGFKAQKIS